jgi:hypothetical protein
MKPEDRLPAGEWASWHWQAHLPNPSSFVVNVSVSFNNFVASCMVPFESLPFPRLRAISGMRRPKICNPVCSTDKIHEPVYQDQSAINSSSNSRIRQTAGESLTFVLHSIPEWLTLCIASAALLQLHPQRSLLFPTTFAYLKMPAPAPETRICITLVVDRILATMAETFFAQLAPPHRAPNVRTSAIKVTAAMLSMKKVGERIGSLGQAPWTCCVLRNPTSVFIITTRIAREVKAVTKCWEVMSMRRPGVSFGGYLGCQSDRRESCLDHVHLPLFRQSFPGPWRGSEGAECRSWCHRCS